jgi:hypothetical protein
MPFNCLRSEPGAHHRSLQARTCVSTIGSETETPIKFSPTFRADWDYRASLLSCQQVIAKKAQGEKTERPKEKPKKLPKAFDD